MAADHDIFNDPEIRDDLESVSLDQLMGQFMPLLSFPSASASGKSFEAAKKARQDELDVAEFCLRYVQYPSTALKELLDGSIQSLAASYAAIGLSAADAAQFAEQTLTRAKQFLY